MKKSCFVLVLIAISFATFAQKNLQFNLKKGETYQQKSTSKIKVSQQYSGMNVDIDMNTINNIDFKIVDIKDTLYSIEMIFSTIKLSMTTPMGNMEFSSESTNPSDKMSSLFAQMTRKPIKATLSKSGVFYSIETEALINEIINSNNLNETEKASLGAQFKEAFKEDMLKGQFGATFAYLTPKAIAKGDKWNRKESLKAMMFTLDSNINFEIVEETVDSYILKYASEISSDPNAPLQNINGMQGKILLNGTEEGIITVNKNTGWVSNSKGERLIKGTLDLQPNEQLPSGMQVPMTISGLTEVSN